MQRVLTSVTLLGLLVLTAAAFAITEHLKLIKSPIFGTQVSVGTQVSKPPQLSAVCHCPNSVAEIRFRLRHSDRVTVTIVNGAHHTVATIASGEKFGARAPQHIPWRGVADDGTVVPDGAYYPWIHLAHARDQPLSSLFGGGKGRTFRLANKIVVDSTPPKVLSASVGKRTFFGGDRKVAIHYAFDEPAHAVVYLDGRQIILGHKTQQQFKLNWAGTVHGRPLRAGKYVLSIGATDIAGNTTPAAKRKDRTVVVRYVELTPDNVAVRGGSKFKVHVKTAASRYAWRLGKQHGSRRGRILHLRAPTTPGRYRLVVTEDGQSSTAVVRVHG